MSGSTSVQNGVIVINTPEWNALMTQLKNKNSYVKVGFPQSGTPVSTGLTQYFNMSDIATIAAFQEFGTRQIVTGKQSVYLSFQGFNIKPRRVITIPPRPFIQKGIDDNLANLDILKGRLYDKMLQRQITFQKALELMGQYLVDKIKATIQNITTPPLHPFTIQQKGSSKPLINTGQMVNSLQYAVVIQP